MPAARAERETDYFLDCRTIVTQSAMEEPGPSDPPVDPPADPPAEEGRGAVEALAVGPPLVSRLSVRDRVIATLRMYKHLLIG